SMPRMRWVMWRSLMAYSGSRMTGRLDGPVRALVQVPAAERIVHEERGASADGWPTGKSRGTPAAFTRFPHSVFSVHPMPAALARRVAVVAGVGLLLVHHRLDFRLGG